MIKLTFLRWGSSVSEVQKGRKSKIPSLQPQKNEHSYNDCAQIHPIIPVMLGDARVASRMAEAMLAEGIYVVCFSYPVVSMDKARILTKMSVAHEKEPIDRTIGAFAKVGRKLGIIDRI